MFQCTSSVSLRGGAFVMPASVLTIETSQTPVSDETFGTGPCVVLTVSELQLHLRLHDYFFGEHIT